MFCLCECVCVCVCDFDLSTLFPNQLIDSPQRVSGGFFYFLVTYSYLSLSLSLSLWLAGFFYLSGRCCFGYPNGFFESIQVTMKPTNPRKRRERSKKKEEGKTKERERGKKKKKSHTKKGNETVPK